MARVSRVESIYPSLKPRGVNPIINDEDINPHVDNTEEMLRKQEGLHRKSIRDGNERGTFEPTGPNTHYRPHSDSLPAPKA